MTERGGEDGVAMLAGAIGNPLRLALIERLLDGPCIVGQLTEAVGAGQAVVSKQLGILREAGLLLCEPQGRCRTYSLADRGSVALLVSALRDAATKAAVHAAECRRARSLSADVESTER